MADTWTGEEPKMTPAQLHLYLTSSGVIHLSAYYSGSGDSADDFYISLRIDRGKMVSDKLQALDAKREAEHKETWRFKNHGEEYMPSDTITPEDIGISGNEIRDILADRIVAVGGAWDFNNDGSSGDIEWDLVTNECELTSGYFETVRHDDGHCTDDLLGFGD